jgi:hypothetical protein
MDVTMGVLGSIENEKHSVDDRVFIVCIWFGTNQSMSGRHLITSP